MLDTNRKGWTRRPAGVLTFSCCCSTGRRCASGCWRARRRPPGSRNAGAESLALLELFTAFQSVLLGRFVSSALRDGDLDDSGLFAGLYILGAKEASIGRVQFRRVAEG